MLKNKILVLVVMLLVGVGALNPLLANAQNQSITAPSQVNQPILLAQTTPCDPATDPDCPPADPGTGEETQARPETCEETSHNNGFPFGWIVCGIITGVGNAIQGIFNWILGLDETTGEAQYCNLEVNLEGTTTTPPPQTPPEGETVAPSSCASFDPTSVERTWSAFRTLANAFFVLAFLYAIYQVAFSSGNNAYLIRSMLPKLAAAVVLVQLSFFLSKILVDISNDLGRYVSEVFTWVFQGQDFNPAAILAGPEDTSFADFLVQSSVIAIGAVAILVSFATIASVIVTMLITVFIILLARKMLILVAIVLAPLAAIAWIHPQTDGFAKAWWQTFSKLLLMYPLIILLIKSGELMARATSTASDSAEFDMVRFVAFFIPFFLIPFTFKFAGGMIGQLAGMANNRSKGLIDRGRGVDQKRKEQRVEKARAQYKANEVAGKKTSAYTRARAGLLGTSILYGKTGGRLLRAEKSSDAKNPQDKLNLFNLQAEESDIKIQQFDIQQKRTGTGKIEQDGNPTQGSLLAEMASPNTSYARRAAITEAMINRRDIEELGAAFDTMAKNGQESDVLRLVERNIGDLQKVAPQYGAGLLSGTVDRTGIHPDWTAITDKPGTEIGDVHRKSMNQMRKVAYDPGSSSISEATDLVANSITRYVQAKQSNSKIDTKVASTFAEIANAGGFTRTDGTFVDIRPHLLPEVLDQAKTLDDRPRGAPPPGGTPPPPPPGGTGGGPGGGPRPGPGAGGGTPPPPPPGSPPPPPSSTPPAQRPGATFQPGQAAEQGGQGQAGLSEDELRNRLSGRREADLPKLNPDDER